MAPDGRLMLLANAIFIYFCICGVNMVAAAAGPGGLAHYKQRITLYAHEVLNENSFKLVAGLPQASLPEAFFEFGTVFVVNYPLFPTYNFSNPATAQGTKKGTHTIVSYAGLEVFFQVNIDLKHPLPVGTLTVSGVFSYLDPSVPVPIVAGTGAYSLLARGAATVTPIEAGLYNDQTYQIDLDLDLPHEDVLLA